MLIYHVVKPIHLNIIRLSYFRLRLMTEKSLNNHRPPSGYLKVELWQYRGVSAKYCDALPTSHVRIDQKKIPRKDISFPNVMKHPKIVRKRRANILNSHIEYKTCNTLTFALLAILIAVLFRMGTDKHKLSPGGDALKWLWTTSLPSLKCRRGHCY